MTTLTRLNSDMGDILLTNLNTPAQDCTITMPVISGKSAYDLAVENGYVGSLQDWLASLSGWKPIDSDFANYLEQHLQLSSLFNGVNSKIEANKAELDNRIAERISEARAISTKLENEAQERIKEANELAKQLLDEAALRASDVSKLRDDLQSEAYKRALAIDQVADDILSEQVTRVNELNNLGNFIDSLDSKVNSNHTYLLEHYSTSSTTTSEIANKIDALKTTYIDPALNTKATVTAVEQVQTNISRIDGELVTVGSKLDGVIAESGKNKQDIAAVWTDMQVRVEAESALSTRIDNVVATTNDLDARIVAETKARTDADSAMASDISAITARVGTTEGKITTLEEVTTTTNSSLSQVSTKLDNLVTTVDGKASSQALNDVSSRVSNAEGTLTSQGQSITKLTNDLNTTNNVVNTKASADSVSALTNRVTETEGKVTSTSNALTALSNRVTTTEGDIAKKADASVLVDYYTKTKADEVIAGEISNYDANLKIGGSNLYHESLLVAGWLSGSTGMPQGGLPDAYDPNYYPCKPNEKFAGTFYDLNGVTVQGSIGRLCFYDADKNFISGTPWITKDVFKTTYITAPLNTAYYRYATHAKGVKAKLEYGTKATDWSPSDVDIKKTIDVNASAISGLSTRVTNNEGNITSQGTSITNLQNSISTINGSLNTKADSSALSSLDNKVTSIDGRVTTNANSITSLQGNVTTINNNLATKADASALSDYYTKAQANEAISGKVDEFKATYSESVLPTDKDTSRANTWSRIVYSKKAPYISDSVVPDYSYLVNYKKHSEDYFAEGRTMTVPVNNSINYYRAVITVSSAKVIDLGNLTGDDAHAVYVDNVKVHSAPRYSTNPCSFSVTAGEHIIDIIVNNGAGEAGFSSTINLSSQVDSMYAVRLVYKSTELNATAISNTYTKAEADSVTTSKIEAFKSGYVDTELGKKFNASAISDYYTKAEANSAISSATTSLSSTFDGKLKDTITIKDTRNDNQPPSWYWANYPRQRVTEFKLGSVLKTAYTGYGNLTTMVHWADPSGGAIQQVFTSEDSLNTYTRYSVDANNWSNWKSDIKDLTAVVNNKVDASVLNSYYTKAEADSAIASQTNEIKTKLGQSTNLLDNSEFKPGFDGWNVVNGGAYSTGMNYDTWCVPGINTAYIHQLGGNAVDKSEYVEFSSNLIPVEPNTTYSASVYMGLHRCNGCVFLYYYDSDKKLFSNSYVADSAIQSGGNTIAGYARPFSIYKTPANVAYVRFMIRKYSTLPGYGDSWLFFMRPHLAKVADNCTEVPPYSASPNYSSIQQHAESINGIKANWTLKLNSNGRISGMTLMNDGSTSEFAIEADNFYVGAIGSAYKPFQVKTVGWTGVDGRSYPSGVYINNAVIGDLDAKVIRAGTITADKLAIGTPNNLVSNFSRTNSGTGWYSYTGIQSYTSFDGTNTPCMEIHTQHSIEVRSDRFKVDPAKSYEFSIWLYSEGGNTTGNDYIGLHAFDNGGNYIVVTAFDVNNPNSNWDEGNPYFWIRGHGDNHRNKWVKYTGYVLAAGTDLSSIKGVLGQNIDRCFRLKSNTDSMLFRILNYYNDGTTVNKLYMAHPTVKEVDTNSLIETVNNKKATSNLYYPGTTLIDGGKIQTGSITADRIQIGSLGRDRLDSTFTQSIDDTKSKIDNLQIGGRNLLLNSDKVVTPNYAADGDNYTYYDNRTCDLIAGETYIVKGVCPSGLNWSNIHDNAKGSTNAVLWLRGANGSHQIISSNTTGTTGTTFTVSVSQRYTLRTNVYKAGQYTFSKIKIEKGNKATDWTPAPEDVDTAIASKAKTFVTTPTIPYSIGDIWRDVNTVKVCTNARASGAYTASDWTLAGDVTANNTSADTAKVNGVSAATVVANAAKGLAVYDDVMSDLKITPVEKTAINQEWNRIQKEYASLIAQATSLSVSTTTLTAAYNELSTTDPAMSTILASMGTTTTLTAAQRDAYKAQYTTYYTQSADMVKAINEKIAANAKSNVDNIQIGGRNLIRHQYISNKPTYTDVSYDKNNNEWTGNVANGADPAWGTGFNISAGNNIRVPYGRTYITSFEVFSPVEVTWAGDVNCYPVSGSGWNGNDNDNAGQRKKSSGIIPANQWTKCWFSYENSSDGNVNKVDLYDGSNFGIINNTGNTLQIKYRNIKGELANKPSEWTPAPEDVQAQIDKSIKSTDVEYYLSTSSTSLSGGSWVTTAPPWTDGKYMWSRTKVVLNDGTIEYRPDANGVNISGATGPKGDRGSDGIAGKDGKGIIGTAITYGLSTSETTQPSTWTSTVPTLVKGQYLWTKTVWTYTDNTNETGYTKTYIAKDGNNGTDGIAGKDGVGILSTTITYGRSTSGTSNEGITWTSSVPSVPPGEFLWTKTVWTYSDNSNETGYSVAKMGETGATGPTGKGISSITEEYYLSTSKTDQIGGSWVEIPPKWENGKYIWTRSKIVWNNPTNITWTTPIVSSEWEAVNEVQIGGRNLAIGSSNGIGWIYDYYSGTEFRSSSSSPYESTYIYSPFYTLKKGETITISFEAKQTTNIKTPDFFILGNYTVEGFVINGVYYPASVDWQKHTFTVIVPNTIVSPVRIRFDHNGSTDGQAATIFVRNVKLEIGNKATDWTPAPEDVQDSINTVDNKVKDIFDDNKITPDEKQSLLVTYKQITNDNDIWRNQAYLLSLDYTRQGNATTTILSTNRPYLGWVCRSAALNQTDTLNAGERTTLMNAIAEYHAANQDLAQRVGSSLRTTGSSALQNAGAANNKIDNLQIGGRNLILNSKDQRNVFRAETYPESYIIYDIANGKLEPNTEYILTWEYLTSLNYLPGMVYFVSNSSEHRSISSIGATNNVWVKKEWKFTTGSNPNQGGIIRFDHKGTTDGQNCVLSVRMVKLEKGNKATDWTPAPEDVDSAISTAQNRADSAYNSANYLERYNVDLDSYKTTGKYFVKSTTQGDIISGTENELKIWMYLVVDGAVPERITQTAWYDQTPDKIWTRVWTGYWQPWKRQTDTQYVKNLITDPNVNTIASDAKRILAQWRKDYPDGRVAIDGNAIAAHTISANQIAVGAITADHIEGGTITGNKIKANTEISAPKIKGGEININENFKVDSQGNLTARSGTFEGTVLADKISGTIDVSSLKRSAWMGGYQAKINMEQVNYPETINYDYPTYYGYFADSYYMTLPSLGGISYEIGQSNFDVGAVMLSMSVQAKYALTVKQKIMVVDDYVDLYINRIFVKTYGTGRINQEVSYNLDAGVNTITWVVRNTGWNSLSFILMGDIIDNDIIKFA